MTDRIKKKLNLLKSGSYKQNRFCNDADLTEYLRDKNEFLKSALLFKERVTCEKPYLHEDDRIGFNISQSTLPRYRLENGELVERSGPGNIAPDYESALMLGMDAIRSNVQKRADECAPDQKDFFENVLFTIDTALEYADRYKELAKEKGADELYNALCRVPHKSATNLLEACVFIKFITVTLRLNRNSLITLGRFDQYMLPFYESDLKAGKTREELLEVIEEFFISINFDTDTDLHPGVQQGDNGQSMMIGGCDKNGNDAFSDFSRLCMEASLELSLIDPKINLRVNKNTPDELYEFATLLTKQGMGFPQYCNDDIVIPGLVKLGYALEDARDYTVAACWEFIIPAKGMDWPNIETMNFPLVVEKAVYEGLSGCETFEEFFTLVENELRAECDRLIFEANQRHYDASPYLSVFVRGCIERGRDISQAGAIYNNYGCHGAGISTAADSLAAIKEVIFDSKKCTKQELICALKNNFEGSDELRNLLLSCPKMGNNDPRTDDISCRLMGAFAGYLNGKPNEVGGIFRAGTGSAMEYIWKALEVGATADGRKAKEPYGSSFSPSLECRMSGLLSCIKSFTKFDMTEIINGGPLTLEIHDSTFRNDYGIQKVAQLVKAFILLGGHQLQLNSVNRDVLLDARKHPEQYKNLIVRVWGWSGYFTELDREYQDHIIKRTEFIA